MDHRPQRPGRSPVLQGRADECARLVGLLADVRRGKSRALLVRGDPGIGKTALLDFLIHSASDLTVLRAAGVESEMELAYASLHQLCRPRLDRLNRLPTPQRLALEIAFGVNAGPPPDRLLVGLGVLTLLAALADEAPLLCVVDDAQWLDSASAQTLAFVARRFLADKVGIVFAAREPSDVLHSIPEMEVRGLADEDARALLASVLPAKLDARIRDRVVAETHGNPLALLELPKGLAPAQLAGGFGLPGVHALTMRIERHFAGRVEALPDETKLLLLAASADPVGDPLLLWRAADVLGIRPRAAAAATAELAIDDRVTFRHPLVRSAVYQSASAEDRRATHLALAEATDPTTDPDRRAWHLAAAAAGPDEDVAGELEHSAERAQARGGVAASAAFLQRSVALSADPRARTRRALAAAMTSLQAGAFDTALDLAATARDGPFDSFQDAMVDMLRGQVAFASGQVRAAPALLFAAAKRLEPLDLDLARETYLTAWAVAAIAGRYAEPDVMHEICRTAKALPPVSGPPRTVDLLLDGLTRLTTDGHAAAASILERAAHAVSELPPEDVLRWGWVAPAASTVTWDLDRLHETCVRQLQIVREAGALSEVNHLHSLGVSFVTIGDFTSAASLMAEANVVAAASGSPVPPYTEMRLRAMQGRAAETTALMASALEIGRIAGTIFGETQSNWAAAVLNNGLGRYPEAASAAQRASVQVYEPYVTALVLPELIEAAIRGDDRNLAQEALEWLLATTQPYANDVARGIESRSRALLATGPDAERLYQEAIERLGRTLVRPELARAHLLYGEWLRRDSRRVDARLELRTAHELFLGIGMEAFAERARNELLATGETVRKRTAETRYDLTSQERQIAELARDGLTNVEIGTRLFLSPRTVEWHIRKVFNKLDITSRRQLRTALQSPESALVQV